jgi:hypothetical protein
MATTIELRTTLDQARANFRAALASVNGNWERQPQSGEGEQAWSPRHAAEHAIGWETGFARAICDACGYPGPDPAADLAIGQAPDLGFTTPEDAAGAFDEAVEKSNRFLASVTDSDLAKPHEVAGSVENLLAIAGAHLNDHAEQIRAASA